jgi:hypothetical protein
MNSRLTVPLQIKTLNNKQFEGHGSIFGNRDYGGDVVLPGAFSRSLADHAGKKTLPPMFWMHDASSVPGKWLDMEEDDKGLYVKGVLADTELGNEIHTLLKMEAVRGMSIGYMTRDSDYTEDGTRLLKDVELFEVSVVSLPMNPLAQVAHVKSRLSKHGIYVPTDDETNELKRDCEDYLRHKGWSKRAAMAGVSKLFSGFTSETPDDPPVKSSETPDEIEIRTGKSNFEERLLLHDLDKTFKDIFNYG